MASNIRVVLELDNKTYISDIKRAENATQSFANNTEKAVGGLSGKFDLVTAALGRFNGVLAALGLSVGTLNAIKFADGIKEISDATGIAVEKVLAFGNVVAVSGGSIEGAQKALLKLSLAIDDAANGSYEAQNTFAKVGVTLNDLRTLSEQDIFEKTIQGLAKIDSASEQVALKQKLLGKEFKAVNIKDVADGYSTAAEQYKKYKDAVESAAKLQDNLDQAFQKVQLSIIKAIQPLADFINKLTPEQISGFIDAIIKLGAALAGLAVFGKVVGALELALGGLAAKSLLSASSIKTMKDSAGLAADAFASLGKTAKISWGYIERYSRGAGMFDASNGAVNNLKTLMEKLGDRTAYAKLGSVGLLGALGLMTKSVVGLVPVIGQAVLAFMALDGAVELLTGRDVKGWIDKWAEDLETSVTKAFPGIASAINALNDKMGLAPSPLKAKQIEKDAQNHIANMKEEEAEINRVREAEKQRAEEIRRVRTEMEKFQQTQQALITSYDNAAQAAQRMVTYEQQYVGMSDNEKALAKIRNDAAEKRISQTEELIAQQRQLQVELKDDSTGIVAQKIAALQDTIDSINQSTKGYADTQVMLTKNLQAAESADRMRVSRLQQVVDIENLYASVLGYNITELEKYNQLKLADQGWRNKSQAELDLLKQQAQVRQDVIATLNVEKTARETVLKLYELESNLLGFQYTEVEKLNQAKAANPEAFARKTQDEVKALELQAAALDRNTGRFKAMALARETTMKLYDLESSLMGRQFTELEKLEQLKAANPEAWARKTQDEITALQQQASAVDNATKAFRELAFARDIKRQGQDFTEELSNRMSADRAINESARRRIAIEIEGRNQLKAKMREIEDRYGDELQLSEELQMRRRREMDEAANAVNNLMMMKRKAVEEDQAVRETFEFGWTEAFNKYVEDANNAATQAKTYFDTFTKGFEDAIVKFVQTGKLSFKDLANSIIADFARIAAKKMATSLFEGVGGAGGGLGGLFSGIGSFFGGLFADGGNPPIGKASIVGERGPELLIPRNASTIVPLGTAGAASGTQVTYNIQAVDASSFRSLVARDPEFIYNVTEQGRKGLPNSGRRR